MNSVRESIIIVQCTDPAFLLTIQADVLIRKKVLSNWITVPCIDQFGSCSYDDFCEILDMIPQCPQPFVDKGVPCKCPFHTVSIAALM